MTALFLPTPPGLAPRTEDGKWGVVMLVRSGYDDDTQWFDFRHAFYQPIVRVTWDQGTMLAALPQDIAELVIERGYARMMTMGEASEYNARIGAPTPNVLAPKPPAPAVQPEPVEQPPEEDVNGEQDPAHDDAPDAAEAEPERKPRTRRKRLTEDTP